MFFLVLYLTTRQWGQTPPFDKQVKQLFSNLRLCLPGKSIVSVLSTFAGLTWCPSVGSLRRLTMGLRAKLDGLIHTNGPGNPPPGVFSCTGKLILESTRFPVLLIDSCGLCDFGLFGGNIGLFCRKLKLFGSLLAALELVMLTIGESGRVFS